MKLIKKILLLFTSEKRLRKEILLGKYLDTKIKQILN